MKVYAVWGDNGESWEDNYQWIECVCSTKQLAEEKTKELNKKAKKMLDIEETWHLYTYRVKEYEVLEK